LTAAFSDAEASIIALWQANWTAAPTAYENTDFNPTELEATDLAAGFANGGPWIALRIAQLPGFGQISTISNGTRRWRYPGLVNVAASIPTGMGKGALTTLLDTAANIFRGYSADIGATGHILFFAPYMTAAGPSPKDPAWFEASMIVRFWFDFDV